MRILYPDGYIEVLPRQTVSLPGGVGLETVATLVEVKPRASLGRAWIAGTIVGAVPLFGVLYWLACDHGDWRAILALQIFVTGVAVLVWLRQRHAFAAVTEQTVLKQSFFLRYTVRRADVATAVIARAWRNGSSESRTELLLKNDADHTIMRFSGTFWSDEDIDAVAEAVGATVVHETTPLSSREFFSRHPGAAYWYEGRPWVAVIGVGVAFAAAFLAVSVIMQAIGAPSAFQL
ncbi:hypothetical protein M2152_002074 [Microbacteriaceae bacterium SG_E_30_P1]|uniref:DUF3592 domain-containing protein n=1 Tax=Antiquaquibacter oligotrophicus TaxID=2880260 RepID=A0ABT6KRR5_9MICO|nr:hypothetical protein [Antiquaquibacter oligotrophicus]MDH6181892.1 hypothetical protein [Antiquaquibacter oligotrophicus]UDF12435.1 hypothetical protein LH407_09715 [Antiquaquibacter oligotrophicus]